MLHSACTFVNTTANTHFKASLELSSVNFPVESTTTMKMKQQQDRRSPLDIIFIIRNDQLKDIK